MQRKVVITGVGVVAPNGVGKEAYWNALEKGASGVRPVTVFDPSFFKTKLAGEVVDFEPKEILGPKGLRNLSRASKLVCSAAKLALTDSGLEVTDDNADDLGVVTGTTLSAIWNIAEFGREVAQTGPQSPNPAMFPGTTTNAPSSQISIWLGIKGFNTTISTGFTASLDALKYAVDFINFGRAKAVLVAGMEDLSFQNYVGFSKVGFLAGLTGEEVSCPFDKRRNGIILAEGSAVLMIEDAEHARARGAHIYAEVNAVANFFDAYRAAKYHPRLEGLKRCIYTVLHKAGLRPDAIDMISASANSVKLPDKLETAVIKEVFHIYAPKIPVSAVKSMIGEAVSAAGLLQVAAAVGAMEKGFVPPTINYKESDADCDLDYVPNKARPAQLNRVLINNCGPGGNNAAAIISKSTDIH